MRITRGLILLICVAMAGACSGEGGESSEPVSAASSAGSEVAPAGSTSSAPPAATPTPVADCGSQFLTSLTPRRKLAQLLTVGVTGTADATQVVANEQVGGIFIGGWTEQGLLGGALTQVRVRRRYR